MKKALAICLLLCSVVCFANKRNINLKPINVKQLGFPKIGIARIESEISGEAIIGRQRKDNSATFVNSDGTLFTGGGTSKSKNLSGGQVFNDGILKKYKATMESELKKAGYDTAGRSGSSLFDEAPQQADDSRFQLGAIIKKCNARTIDDSWGNDVTQCHMEEVEWQVFDRQTKKVIFKHKTSGWDRKRGVAVPRAAKDAFRKAFRNFLASQEFVDALKTAYKAK